MHSYFEQLDLTHWTGHLLSVVAMVGSMFGIFPAAAAAAAFIWYCVQIYESDTLQKNARAVLVAYKRRRIAKLIRLRDALRDELSRLGNPEDPAPKK